jgi:cell fate regulator YaaT (PSP1 superfamily)
MAALCRPLPEVRRAPSPSLCASTGEARRLFPQELNLLYDSKCAVCRWEVDFLSARDSEGKLTYTDVESPEYDETAARNGRVDYGTALASFHAVRSDGEVLRVATMDDLAAWERISMDWGARTLAAKQAAIALGIHVRLVQIEPILGDEQVFVWVHPTVEGEIDLAPMKSALAPAIGRAAHWQVIGARDEARLVADREKCGQSVCCSTFLKVLKPVSIKHAKVQGHTLDPLKISGRCGRLMCCLRYEDQTYAELAAKLPKRGTVVGTAEGVGSVVETRTLVQLVLVRLHASGQDIAVPVEELVPVDQAPATPAAPPAPRPRGKGGDGKGGDGKGGDGKRPRDRR